MTKKNSLLAAIALFSVCALYAFAYPDVVRDNVLTLFFPDGERPVAVGSSSSSSSSSSSGSGSGSGSGNRQWQSQSAAPTSARSLLPLPTATATATLDTFPPLSERYDDFINAGGNNPVDLRDPKVIERQVEYDAASDMYIITERIGDDFYRAPTYMSFEEYVQWRDEQQQRDYFDRLQGVVSADGKSADGTSDPVSKFNFKNSLIDRLFGGTNVDIKPQGNINLTFGYDWQKIQNPILTLRQQTNGNFDFDMDINMSAQGKIGEKLNLNFNYNTQATFDFDNQMKINYDTKGFSEDEIIQSVEAGNVSMPLRSNLIKGAQNLFGIKTEMKFGHLRTTLVASQQRSKQQSLKIQGGSQVQTFEKPIDEYDENRHFFVSHWNRDQFEPAMKCLPVPQSLFNITRMEVWITNDKQEFQNTRDVVPLADLGEALPSRMADSSWAILNPPGKDIYGNALPANQNNGLYSKILDELSNDPQMRFSDRVVSKLTGPAFATPVNMNGMKQIREFEKMNARLLSSQEYSYNEQLGFVSINLNVQPDQVVGVALSYTYNGTPYKIGEFSDEVPKKSSEDTLKTNVLFLKMLKSTTANVKYPIWDLMMKNVYAVGTANVDPQEFRFDIYYEDPGYGQKRFLDGPLIPDGLKNRPLLQVFNLDNLNLQGDPGPDGIFDFIPGITINLRSGRIMFPVLEPFGSDLYNKLKTANGGIISANDSTKLFNQLIYQQLYDSTTFVAREYQQLNRFMLRGTYKSSVSSEISLGTFNLPPGSVRVTAGGSPLREGIDYSIDYNIGKVRILNDAILQSGQSVNVSFEDNTFFGFQSRSMVGARFDYAFSKDLSVGATFMNLFERPLTQKVNFGDDPINNKVYGLDFSISKDAPWLTKLIDKLPLISTKEPSSISAQAEVAVLQPGHNRAINQGGDQGGTVYLDDFEGSTANIPLTTQFNQWVIASVPQGDLALFPESDLSNTTLSLSANRAGLSWYISDPSARDQEDGVNPYTRLIQYQDIFPNRQLTPFEQSSLRPLDVTIYPRERGPYNFEIPTGYSTSAGLNTNGELNLPESRWAGFMKELNTNDFEASNIEFIEFWMLNPYMGKTDEEVSQAGQMYIDLGSISEDVMRDSRQFFENGLPTGTNNVSTDISPWGRVPIEAPIVNAFDNNEASRIQQDVGLDGLDNEMEKTFGEIGEWYQLIQNTPSTILSPNFKASVEADPSNDDFVYFRDNSFPQAPGGPGLLNRYRKFNNQQGNSPVNQSDNQNPSSTNYPDQEDLNRDRSLNETEAYFRYKIDLKKTFLNGQEVIDENDPAISEYITNTVNFTKDGREYIWYRFKIPLDDKARKSVGGIEDFRSVRFIRMFWKGFDERTTFRFATLELGRNQWRRFKQNLEGCGFDGVGNPPPIPFDVNAVNIEENSARMPFNYTIPFGIQREQSVGAFPDILQNEQSLAMTICSLKHCDARAVFKSLNMDLRQFKRMKMFAHAEEINNEVLDSSDLKIFIRMGSDYTRNYYEYELPLVISDPTNLNGNPDSRAYKEEVWRNNFDFPLELLTEVKKQRNADPNAILDKAFVGFDPDNPEARVRILGNPNLGYVKGIMIGVRNSDPEMLPHCVEAWINELRLSGFNEKGGFAGLARVDMKLADLGGVALAANYTGIGWGSIEEKLAQRQREEVMQYDVSTNIELGKLLPEKSGLKIPFYAQYSNITRNPEYDPYDLDIKLKDKLRETNDAVARDSIRTSAQDITVVKGYNFTNVRKERRGKPRKVPLPWNIENFSVTYAYNEQEKRTPFILSDRQKQYKGGLDWQYGTGMKPITPFKKLIKKDKYLKFITDFNFNPVPNTYGFNTNLERFEGITTYRFAGEDASLNTYYNRRFTWERNYDLGWDISKALRFNFDATARSLIDEPLEYESEGGPRVTRQERRDSILTNLKSLGRPKGYTHNASLNWTLPFKQIPMLDFVNMKASYTAGYTWTAQSLKLQNLDAKQFYDFENSRNLGNTIQNNNVRQINGDFNMETLYNKSKYLSKINKPGKPVAGGNRGNNSSKPAGRRGTGNDGNGSSPNPDRGGRPGANPASGGKDNGGTAPGGKGKDGANDRNDPTKPPTPTDPSNPGTMNPPGAPLPGAPGGIDPVTGRPTRTRPNPSGADPANPAKDKDAKDKKGKDKKKEERIPTLAERIALRPLMLVRKARFTYSENRNNVIPGFTPETKLMGLSEGFDAPGWGFVTGFQEADRAYLDQMGAAGNITHRPELNQQVMKNYTQNLDMGVTVEPFRDFRVELTANKQYSRNSTVLYKDQIFNLDPDSVGFEHRAARDLGSYTISFIAMNTMFNKDIAGLFTRYESYRPIISDRLARENGLPLDSTHSIDDGYKKGYGRIHQEVLIPAFLAAYTKRDPNSVGMDIFKTMPAPNWKLTYNGLSKLGNLKNVFSSIQISHGYKNTLTVNSYNTDIFYDDANRYDTNNDNYNLNFNYTARYEIPQVVINEQFQPLFGIDVKLKNEMTFKADVKRARTLSMSFIDYQLSETKSSGYTLGFGYRMKNVNIPFLTGKKNLDGKSSKKKKSNKKKKSTTPPAPPTGGSGGSANDLNFKFDFEVRDDITIAHILDSPNAAQPTRGARTISLNPQVEYALNKRLKLRLFADYRKTVPKTSQSFPITTLNTGVTVQFSLN
ncbi:MAG: cell surface protein SprA [Saprospiraceae bacterium]|nr:cell surface protein SprA [Saprospiraceae bacterium]